LVDFQDPGQFSSHLMTGTILRQKQPWCAGVAVVTSRCLRRRIEDIHDESSLTTLMFQVFDCLT
jgi:hypothetical protein